MHGFITIPSVRLSFAALAILALLASPGPTNAETGDAPTPPEDMIRVGIKIDPSKTGPERCVNVPENLVVPRGVSNVTWSVEVAGGAEAELPGLARVEFEPELPITASSRVDKHRWKATFDCGEAFEQTEYDVFVRETDGTLTECYPHVAGSTDQGGGG